MKQNPAATVPEPKQVFDVVMPDGAIVRVRRHGNPDGPRLLLSHGNGLAIDGYLPFWGPLRGRYDLILFDCRNHGQNPVHGASGHNLPTFAADLEEICRELDRRLGAKPIAGAFHSLSSQAAIKHALRHPERWRALVLFDPPVHPHEGHPLETVQRSYTGKLAARARRRPKHYRSPHELAEQFASRSDFRRWRHEAYELIARATLRPEDSTGQWVLACPADLEAKIFDSRDPKLWTEVASLKVPVKLICGDPELDDVNAPSLLGQAVAREAHIPYEAIPDTTHFLQLERPEECIRAMEAFLSEHGMVAAR